MVPQTVAPHLLRLFPVFLSLALVVVFAVQLRLGRIPVGMRKYTIGFSAILLALCAVTLFRTR
jgi:hypothetical protein